MLSIGGVSVGGTRLRRRSIWTNHSHDGATGGHVPRDGLCAVYNYEGDTRWNPTLGQIEQNTIPCVFFLSEGPEGVGDRIQLLPGLGRGQSGGQTAIRKRHRMVTRRWPQLDPRREFEFPTTQGKDKGEGRIPAVNLV